MDTGPQPAPRGLDPKQTRTVAPTSRQATTWLLPGLVVGAVGATATMKVRRERDIDASAEAEGPPSDPTSSDASPTPPGIDGVLLLGQEALDRGDLEAAVGWFETAIAISPDLQAAHFCLGLCLDELGRLEEAVESLQHARELDAEDPLAIYTLASALARAGQEADSVDLVAHLLNRHPGFVDELREDEEFGPLRDHPRFLALLGEL